MPCSANLIIRLILSRISDYAHNARATAAKVGIFQPTDLQGYHPNKKGGTMASLLVFRFLSCS